MQNIQDIDVTGKKVLVRADFNVPLEEQGGILDDFRIRQALPTIQYLIGQNAKVILLAHLGEPDGKIVERLKVKGIKEKLEELLGMKISYAEDCVGKEVESAALQLQDGHVLLLENVRFHKEEEENNEEFAKELSHVADVYVNDAFDVCHRLHASVVGVPKFLPHAAGLLLQKELRMFANITHQPERPMVVLIGGAKAKTKAQYISPFCAFADLVIVGGLIKKELIDQKIPLEYPEKVYGPKGNLDAPDLTAEDLEKIIARINQAKTIFWNGPFGNIENPDFTAGTRAVARAIIESGAHAVVGGGETVAFLEKEGMIGKFDNISTGGGAMLAYLAGQELSGLVALDN